MLLRRVELDRPRRSRVAPQPVITHDRGAPPRGAASYAREERRQGDSAAAAKPVAHHGVAAAAAAAVEVVVAEDAEHRGVAHAGHGLDAPRVDHHLRAQFVERPHHVHQFDRVIAVRGRQLWGVLGGGGRKYFQESGDEERARKGSKK